MEIGRLSKETGFLRRVCILGSSFLSFISQGATQIFSELILQALSTESYKEKWLHMHSELKWDKQKLYSQTYCQKLGWHFSRQLHCTLFLISMTSLIRFLLLLLKEQFLSQGLFTAFPGPLTQGHKMPHLRNCKCLWSIFHKIKDKSSINKKEHGPQSLSGNGFLGARPAVHYVSWKNFGSYSSSLDLIFSIYKVVIAPSLHVATITEKMLMSTYLWKYKVPKIMPYIQWKITAFVFGLFVIAMKIQRSH